jgi:hypothetical protein
MLKTFNLLISLVLVTACGTPSTTSTDNELPKNSTSEVLRNWNVSEITPIGIEGVSPELIKIDDGDFLLLTTSTAQKRVFTSKDGVAFTQLDTNLPIGSDYSLLQKSDGTWLLYFVGFDMPRPQNNSGGKPAPNPDGQPMPMPIPDGQLSPLPNQQPAQQMSAVKGKKKIFVSTSTDLISFGEPIFTGIEQPDESPAWGVPDTYFDTNGNFQMMWVAMVDGERYEVLKTATSIDGINFSENSRYVIKGGFVDPYMLQAEESNWVLMLSTTPDDSRLPQKIYMATSDDGLTWDIGKEPILSATDLNYLDPTAVKISDDQWRIIFSVADKDKAISGPHQYQSALLTLK